MRRLSLFFLLFVNTSIAQVAFNVHECFIGGGMVQYKGLSPKSNLDKGIVLGWKYHPLRQIAIGTEFQYGIFSGGSVNDAYGWYYNTTFYSGQVIGELFPFTFGMKNSKKKLLNLIKTMNLSLGVGVIGTQVNEINRTAKDGTLLYGDTGILAPFVSLSSSFRYNFLNAEYRPWAFMKFQTMWTLAINNQLGGYANPPVISGDTQDNYWVHSVSFGIYFGGLDIYYESPH